MVGRLGGDEFAIVLPNLSDPLEAANICDDLIASFRAPFGSEGQDAFLGLSLGIAMSPSHGDCATDLLASADFALYRAKSEPGVGYCVFQPSFRQAALARRNCDQELRQAVAQGELEMHYQPLVRLADYCVTGAEALLRWRHPQHGLIAPDAFLDVLERGRLARSGRRLDDPRGGDSGPPRPSERPSRLSRQRQSLRRSTPPGRARQDGDQSA
jgi:predicted signal transduction protein with EAL and GGDEF domain